MARSDLEALAVEARRIKLNYRNQMPVETAEQAELQQQWREDWSALAQQYGTDVVIEALERHRKVSRFLPSRYDVEDGVSAVREERRAARMEREGQRFSRVMAEAKATWERERAEDAAAAQAQQEQAEGYPGDYDEPVEDDDIPI